MVEGIKKISRSVRAALNGLRQAYCHDRSFALEIDWGSPIYLVFAFLVWPLSRTEWLILVLSYALILITELLNTSMERMLVRVHPEEHELIGHAKDIGSAAVLVAFLFAITVALSIALARIFV